MRKVIVAWAKEKAGKAFEQNVPLAYLAARYHRLGYATDFDLVFLEGLSRLEPGYRASLEDCGYRLIDAETIFTSHAARHAVLTRFGPFEQRCFLRWLVLADIYRGEPFLHVDGDVVFNDCPDRVAGCFASRTLVLQGCPALTAVSDPLWLTAYAGQLAEFCRDIDGYSATAWQEREGWEQTYRTRWAGTRDRRIITSDQDLISHLIHTDRLRQDSPQEFLAAAGRYAWFENPLHAGDWVGDRPLVYRRDNAADYFNHQRVAIWHMQSDWCRYLGKLMLRESIGASATLGRLGFNDGGWEDGLNRVIRKLARGRWPTRVAIYRRFFSTGDFSAIFSPARWWCDGLFTRPR